MEISEIKQKIVVGDMKLAAHIAEITHGNARMALKRVGSKYHERVKAALVKIFAMREALIKESGENSSHLL